MESVDLLGNPQTQIGNPRIQILKSADFQVNPQTSVQTCEHLRYFVLKKTK